jgi:tRNA threonylcarbamoyladenosine biosynthesis protein TsaB
VKILAIDSSSRAVSCAVVSDGHLICENFANTGLTHSQTLMPMVEQLLNRAGAGAGDIDVFAVSTGPGSFTGLRIGIATVKGLSFATGKLCARVPTLLGLSYNAQLFSGYIAPVMDARRGQVYTALFRSDGFVVSRETRDEAISLCQLKQRLSALAPQPVILVGDGASMAAEELSGLSHITLAPERFLHQRAGSVGLAAVSIAEKGGLVSSGELAPEYLRLPQAEREAARRTINIRE